MTIQLFSSTKNEVASLNEKSKLLEREMVTDQHNFFLSSSGLQPFLAIINDTTNSVNPPNATNTDPALPTPSIFNGKSRVTIAETG
jgi:hypothetical protein